MSDLEDEVRIISERLHHVMSGDSEIGRAISSMAERLGRLERDVELLNGRAFPPPPPLDPLDPREEFNSLVRRVAEAARCDEESAKIVIQIVGAEYE